MMKVEKKKINKTNIFFIWELKVYPFVIITLSEVFIIITANLNDGTYLYSFI